MNKLRSGQMVAAMLVVLAWIVGLWVYPLLPDQVASHWSATGEVNGYMSPFWGAFLLPLVLIALFLVFHFLPRLDPKRQNIEKFQRHFDRFVVILFLFLWYVYMLTLFWNMYGEFQMLAFLMPGLAVVFWFIGDLLASSEPNWSIGVRTPWTLSSDSVWHKTNKRGGIMFQACGVIALFGIFFQDAAVWLVLVPILVSAIYLTIYSYVLYRRDHRPS